MDAREARELARIRHELRDRLMSCRHEGADTLLARLRAAADARPGFAPELRAEYDRWRLRFELLAEDGPGVPPTGKPAPEGARPGGS